MTLKDGISKIKNIGLDPLNPRDSSLADKNQKQILNSTMDKPASRELLKSMQDCIRWVNKIVVISLADYKDLYSPISEELEQFSYIAVEGNTRLSCLKSNKISNYTDDTEIPIIIATRDSSETLDSFKESILITQGIANVMVVKEWSPIAKAKHIYDMFTLKLKNSAEQRKDAIKKATISISQELGISQDDVRKAVKRYTIYAKLAEDVQTITDDKWGYLEAFDINADTRASIGLSDDLEWDSEKTEGILPLIPDLIDNAFTHSQSTKQFRDYYRNYISECNEKKTSYQDIVDSLSDVINSDDNKTVASLVSEKMDDPNDIKTDWDNKLDNMYKVLMTYPTTQEFATGQLSKLEIVSKQVSKIIKAINVLTDD